MHDSWLCVAVLAGLSVGATLTGRGDAVLVPIRMLRRWTPENVLASAFLGTAVWVLTFGYCSYLGLAAPAATGVVLAVLRPPGGREGGVPPPGVPFRPAGAGCCWPSSWRPSSWLWRPHPAGPGRRLLRFSSDSLTYNSVAEWLQSHGFCELCPGDPGRPTSMWMVTIPATGHRIGADVSPRAGAQALVRVRWPSTFSPR